MSLIRGTVPASMDKGYSKSALTQQEALHYRLLRDPQVGRPECMEPVQYTGRQPSFFPGRGGGIGGGGGGGGRGGGRGKILVGQGSVSRAWREAKVLKQMPALLRTVFTPSATRSNATKIVSCVQ